MSYLLFEWVNIEGIQWIGTLLLGLIVTELISFTCWWLNDEKNLLNWWIFIIISIL